MYNRIYKFFSDNNLICSLQSGFRQEYSTVHSLISLPENNRKNLDEGNIACTFKKTNIGRLTFILPFSRLEIHEKSSKNKGLQCVVTQAVLVKIS